MPHLGQSGRSDRPGNRKVSGPEGRSGSAGNRKVFIPYHNRLGEARGLRQENGGAGRSARPGDCSPVSVPRPATGFGKGTVSTAGIPSKSKDKFQQKGVRY